ncbi:MAG: zinc-binding dehydrogenase [Clostridia bacterium]|nr:zinc-binding dehydrogenase [Clostridia bacterium]
MKGWEFRKTHEPLVLVERETPKAKPGYVVLKVTGCGLCHTDVSTLEDPGWMSILGKVPCILGHEIAGEIIEVGEGVKNFKVGERVAVCPMVGNDGTGAGNGRDGGYATHTTAPEEMLIHIPDEVDTLQAAASTDAGMTSYHAVVGRGGVKKGTKVGLIGIGGLGSVGTRIAVEQGAQVYVASRKEAARADALKHGAFKAADSILDFKDDGLEVIIDFAGSGKTTADALEAVAPGGTVVVVGMTKLESTINTGSLILKEVNVIGSVGGSKKDIEAVLTLMKEGRLQIDVLKTTFDDVPENLELLHQGKVTGGRMIMCTSDKDYQ